MLPFVLFIITCIQHVEGSPKEEVYLKKKMIEKWDNFFSENYLDKQPQTDEFQEDVLLLINA